MLILQILFSVASQEDVHIFLCLGKGRTLAWDSMWKVCKRQYEHRVPGLVDKGNFRDSVSMNLYDERNI